MNLERIIESQAYGMLVQLVAALPRIGLALVVLLLTWALGRLSIRWVLRGLLRGGMRRALAVVLNELMRIAIWLVGLLIAAAVAFPSVTPGSVVTALGLGSVALGFTFRGIFENFLAGVLILYREPFRFGDCIEASGYEGFVEQITIRDTHLRQTDGQLVVLPNAALFNNPVTVRTDLPVRRTTVPLTVAHGADLDAAKALIEETVAGLETVETERAVQIFARAFTEGGIEFELTWWVKGSKPVDIRRSRDEIVRAVTRALVGADIAFEWPRRLVAMVGEGAGGEPENAEGGRSRP
ncbi:MAG TPA: mechanosensitive ion channel family protein [Alphaproteobacteria bacterium]|nr:mechanosensitive ion channel family protein [Alphaproteobacteria bacterium]